MKIRQGFVSNSSSSSFIIITNKPITKEFLENEYKFAGGFAAPFISFLLENGDDNLDIDSSSSCGCGCHDKEQGEALEEWKKENNVKESDFFREYRFTNQGRDDDYNEVGGPIGRAFYHNGYAFLATKNIRVIPGTYYA